MFAEENGRFPVANTPRIFTGRVNRTLREKKEKEKHGIACSVSSISARDENNVVEYENNARRK